MCTRNLDAGRSEAAAYVEHPLGSHLSVYVLAVANGGGPRREFDSLIRNALTAGLRYACRERAAPAGY